MRGLNDKSDCHEMAKLCHRTAMAVMSSLTAFIMDHIIQRELIVSNLLCGLLTACAMMEHTVHVKSMCIRQDQVRNRDLQQQHSSVVCCWHRVK